MSETLNKRKITVRTFAQLAQQGKTAEYLFWVGSAGSYDDRAKKIIRDFVKLLEFAKVDYAVLGTEEIDTGDSAKRAGNEFLFQMQAFQIIELLKAYEVKRIITCDPHDFNILKNEYTELGGNYDVWHHTQFLQNLINEGKLQLSDQFFSGKTITYHDPCYLGRGNSEYAAPRNILNKLSGKLVEPERFASKSFCCGAGGAQMFKEAEKGTKEVFIERTEELLKLKPQIIATACPFCMTMLTDGVKMAEKKDEIQVLDIAEILVRSLEL
ncbi:MAG TPA: CoB--CoM heterodisulfide reductase [Bacteroidales bacterium]|nr:CoB--CoM heterodisulfide reductase [Bacteroidales bacterium]